MKSFGYWVLFAAILLLLPQMSFAQEGFEKATFAGGCFWCMEKPFEELEGVIDVVSGYTGGTEQNPSYQDVSSGQTGHAEAVEITFDASRISYNELLDVFWRQIDPTDAGGQFADRGNQYRTGIFTRNEEQKKMAESSKQTLAESQIFKNPLVTEITPASAFFKAEDYHQNYHKTHPVRYKAYRTGSGRDIFLNKTWKLYPKLLPKPGESGSAEYEKPDPGVLRKKLTPLQYKVTQLNGTERAYDNAYWNNKKEGLYVDIVSGEPLFSSRDKFDSKTGWPAFTKPVDPAVIVERPDRSHFMVRTEVRSKQADSHLGHVFEGGPPPTGRHYCINSAALRFIPYEDLEKESYGRYKILFTKK